MARISFLVAATAIMLCWTGLTSAQILQEMEVKDLGLVPVVVRNPDVGILIVESVIPELSFESNMGIIKVTHERPGEWVLHLFPGTNLITFKAEGYKSVNDMRLVVPKKRAAVSAATRATCGRRFATSSRRAFAPTFSARAS